MMNVCRGKYYRQTMIFSAFASLEISALLNRSCHSTAMICQCRGDRKCNVYVSICGVDWWGQVKTRAKSVGVVERVAVSVKQVFQRLECESVTQADDVRFAYFTQRLLPRLRASAQSHIVLFIPSYFDYVRVRNYFRRLQEEEEVTFCQCCEYTTVPNVARARSYFFMGRVQFMLLTERFYFYRRCAIRGVRNLVFYAPPQHAQFFVEFLNMLPDADNSCTTLFTRFDAFQLERIVGADRLARMLHSDQSTTMLIA